MGSMKPMQWTNGNPGLRLRPVMPSDTAPGARTPCVMPWSWLWAALLLGCQAVAPARAQAPERAPPAAGAPPAPARPLAEMTPPVAGQERFAGVVEERLEAGSYADLAVRTDDARLRWVATMGEGRAIGTRVAVRNMGTRTDFHSRRLDRTFSELVFGVVDDAG